MRLVLPEARARRSAVALLAALCVASSAAAAGLPRGVVVVSFDTVRRDHLEPYGYPRPTSPALAGLARASVVFDAAYAQAPSTVPSHASLFTGLYPKEHGSRQNGMALDGARRTLAEVLADAGFRTGAFVSGAPMRAALSGLDQGFEVYDDAFEGVRRDGGEVVRRALDWLGALEEGERFFLFVHLYDAHGRYAPPDELLRRFRSAEPGPRLERIPRYQLVRDAEGRPLRHLNDYVDRYDASIRYMDDRLAELLAALELEDTVVAVLSDHGETLGERHHALDHGGQLFEEQVGIALVLHAPGLAPAREPALVETVDLLPTLLTLVGVAPGARPETRGHDLLALLEGRWMGRAWVYAHALSRSHRHADRGYRLDPRLPTFMVHSARWKLIQYPGVEHPYVELYDLREDPGERRDVAADRPDLRGRYARALERWWHTLSAPAPAQEGGPPIPAPLREQLRALGYADE